MGKGDEYQDNAIDIYAYFNSSCYSGFHDDEGVSLHLYVWMFYIYLMSHFIMCFILLDTLKMDYQ